MIRLTINGEEQEFPDATPLSEYVSSLGVSPKMIAVAYNGEVLRRDEWAEVTLSDGDSLEVVRAVGGGCGASKTVRGDGYGVSSPTDPVTAKGSATQPTGGLLSPRRWDEGPAQAVRTLLTPIG